jgi:6-phosphofructokinase 1
VHKCVQVQAAMNEHDWVTAVSLRGRTFARNLNTYKLLTKMNAPKEKDNLSLGQKFNVAVMNVGAPAGGMY